MLLHTMATPDMSPTQALDFAQELELDGLDLICQADYRCAIAPDAPIEVARQLRQEADARGLVIGAMTPYEKRSNSPSATERNLALDAFCHAIDLGAALGARSVRVFAGAGVEDRDWERGVDAVVSVMREAASHAADHGIGLNLENHDGTMADSAARTYEIWKRINAKNVGIVYDPANLIRDAKEAFPESLNVQLEAIRLVHVKDYSFVPGTARSALNEAGRRSVPVGDGEVPWAGILPALKAHGYDGDLTLEYEMRWVPDQLPPTRIGVARSRDFLKAILARLPDALSPEKLQLR
jgi:sugar phosphate isomerase/epimerase